MLPNVSRSVGSSSVITSQAEKGRAPVTPPAAKQLSLGDERSTFLADTHAAAAIEASKGPSLRKPSAAEFWNLAACNAVAQTRTVPPLASRIYTLLSAAQYEAAKRLGGATSTETKLAVAAASAHVLCATFEAKPVDGKLPPGKLAEGTMAALSRGYLREALSTPVTDDLLLRAAEIGREAAETLLAREDNLAEATAPNPEIPVAPTRPGVWFSSANPPSPGLLPNWGKLTPWHMPSSEEKGFPRLPAFRYGSTEFKKQLAEVLGFSRKREANPAAVELKIARFWADNPGTATPPGHWNDIAREHIAKAGLSEVEAARVFFYLNSAMADAGVACWEQKYAHMLLRPSQENPEITVPADVGLPNFPAYPSGHASFSGAAAEVLEHFFPGGTSHVPYASAPKTFSELKDDAALSRVYGGIHYRQDGDGGIALGRAAGQFAVQAAKSESEAPCS